MPGLDKTGPLGKGSMTGRRLGECTGAGGSEEIKDVSQSPFGTGSENQNTNPDFYGVGRGGRPRGCGNGFCGGRGVKRRI
ncbi:hypothetical protein F1737_08540 [Methanoplanus sp. FWC-SCC4]|uniref:DUF5320 domain-containing protein n=1 Tax=Methanochimaera problematica TaxID=2609417 RepID=A0AA97FEU1_9EURY|nr:DUF5320 domain-containing protein [Methanoplanus sp. FWC-SCC4]WOF16733.1 hypothetical protein F1737_08540 [Methanoplanus sp. FWC-SCC4]